MVKSPHACVMSRERILRMVALAHFTHCKQVDEGVDLLDFQVMI